MGVPARVGARLMSVNLWQILMLDDGDEIVQELDELDGGGVGEFGHDQGHEDGA